MNRVGVTLCRQQADCTGLAMCVMQEPPRGCGNPAFLPQQCATDEHCPDGVCQFDGCGGSVCVAACTDGSCGDANKCVDGHCVPKRCDEPDAAPCGNGFDCDANSPNLTGCVPVHCTNGTECPTNSECVATAPGNGCVPRTCTADRDCDCGYCVNSSCQPTLGFCYEIVAMPYGCVWPDEELV